MPSAFGNNVLQDIGALWDRTTRWLVPEKAYAKVILEPKTQIRAWRKGNQTMGWGIREDEFDAIGQPPEMNDKDRKDGFVGVVLSYGFGDFYDAPFLLATRNVLGIGVGNVSRPYPRYGSGTLR